jgi:hypothetical protein
VINYGIIINDFRSIPFFAAIDIYRLNKFKASILFILSERRLKNNSIDYGDNLPCWYRKLKIVLLKLIGKVVIIRESNEKITDSRSHESVISSLRSITLDSEAEVGGYEKLATILEKNAIGAEEIAEYIVKESFDRVYIFNGRTASSSPIICKLHDNKIECYYYEYSLKKHSSGYVLFPYSVHASHKIGIDLVKQRLEISNDKNLTKMAEIVRKNKLNNEFTKYYQTQVKTNYYCVVFLGSDHEYTNLQTEIVGITSIGNLELVNKCIKKYSNFGKIAVRAHPNQRNDISGRQNLEKIEKLCDIHKIDFFKPESSVSSYSLITNSDVTAAEYSSILFDAIYLGKKVDIFSNRDLSQILEYAKNLGISSPFEIAKFVSECYALLPNLYHHKFKFILRLLSKILASTEYNFLLRKYK